MSWIWVLEKVRAMIGLKKSESLKTMFPEDLEEYMKSHEEGSYTLLDVRQPSEYEETHLPGARLVPLPRLMDALGELDRRRPTIVYCAVGGRSRTAAQFLLNQGFEDVHNLQGGIQAWEQPTAFGPSELHLRFVRGDESPREVVAVAYEMEEGLRQFHQRMKDSTSDPGLAELLTHLFDGAAVLRRENGFEDVHRCLQGTWNDWDHLDSTPWPPGERPPAPWMLQ